MKPSRNDDFERMIDEIAASKSAAELEWLRAEASRRFASDSRRADLERLIDQMLLIIPPRPAPDPTGE